MSDHHAAYVWKQQVLNELRNFVIILDSKDYRILLEELKIEIEAILNTRYLVDEMYEYQKEKTNNEKK